MQDMCGRYTISSSLKEIRALFSVSVEVSHSRNFEARYNVAPSNTVPIISASDQGNRLTFMSWGMKPLQQHLVNKAGNLINARSETLDKKVSFRDSFLRRRCLIPANGYYEWPKQNIGKKQPSLIFLKEKTLFGLAGIWQAYTDISGNVFHSFAIITTRAAVSISYIHHRMPLIISNQDYDTWLYASSAEAKPMMQPYCNHLQSHMVSERVNNPTNDDKSLIDPVFNGGDPTQLSLL